MDIRSFFSPPGAKKSKAAADANKKKPLSDSSPIKTAKEEKPVKKETPKKKESSKKIPTPKKKLTPKKGKKTAAIESDEEDEVNIIDEASDEEPIPSKKKNKNNEFDDFINDESSEEEDPIPRKKTKGKAKEEKVKRSSSGSSSKENSGKKANRKKDDKKRKAPSYDISSSSEDDFQTIKASSKKKGNKVEQINGKKSKKKASKEISSSDDEDDMRNVKRTSSKKKGATKKKKGVIFDSDSEDDSVVPPTQKKPRRERKKGPTYVCDSDEEKPDIKAAFERTKPKSEPSTKTVKPPSPEKSKKQVSVMDFFGGGAIHRVESKTSGVASNKRKAESPVKKPATPIKKNTDDFEMEMHDDDDFEATLSMLDEEEEIQKAKKARIEEPQAGISPKRESFASKLAAKAKNETFVPDTPEPRAASKKSPVKPPFKTKAKHHMDFEKKSPVKSPPKPVTPSPKKVTPKKPSPATPAAAASDSERTPQLKRGGSYRSYLARAGPQALGSKEIPQGEDNCLEGLTFVITGILESMERDEAKSLLERYGGKVTRNISRKTNYLVLGRDGGESKTAKAQQLGTKIVDEDGMLDLIRTLPGKRSKYEVAAEKEASKFSKKATPVKKNEKVTELSTKFSRSSPTKKASVTTSPGPSKPVKAEPASPAPSGSRQQSQSTGSPGKTSGTAETLLWVDKYKPQNLKQIIGQQGDKSNAKKLLMWLKNWHKNRALGKKPVFNRFNDDGSGCKAALLSGPPGVGKTTTATIVCKEAGFTFVELNASDTRSKKSLQTQVAELLGNHSLMDYMGGKKESSASSQGIPDGQNHCLVMDEVDGMAGNEDRGGMAELIQLIKNSKIPIICMCNDRNHQKIRSLANYCFDLRFQRPRVEQIKSAMMSLAFKEGIKIPPPALNEIILAANQDVRQVIHNLSMWSANDKSMSYDQVKKDASAAKKDMKLGPFDVCRKVFVGGEETARMTINDKSDLFFHDYQFGPLFVHENYPTVTPRAASNMKDHLKFLAKAADSIADGDLVDRCIRRGQKWSLLPVQAVYSSVIPGEMMRGSMSSMVQFPSWLGKNSSQNKQDRILSELRSHMCLKISGDKRSLALDYMSHMKRSLTDPLVRLGSDGARDVIDTLDEYDLLREDFDNILESATWPGQKNPMENVESKTKAAFTRQYNKESHMTPYAAVAGAKKGRGRTGGGAGADAELLAEEGEEGAAVASENEDSDNPDADAMIKAKKKPTGKGKGQSGAEETSKGQKGQGKGKGKGRGKGKK